MQRFINWNEQIEQIKHLDRISTSTKQYITRGWNHLRTIMGEDWLEEAWENKHPWYTTLYWNLHLNTPWVKYYYAHFGFKLRAVSSVPNFDAVLEQLRSEDKSLSAMAETNAAYKLLKERIKFEFQPTTQKKKTPDISIHHDRRSVGVEVSIIKQSQDITRRLNQLMTFTNILNGFGMCGAGIMHRPLSNRHAGHIIEQLVPMVERARREDRFEKLSIEGEVAEFCVAPKREEGRVLEWKAAHEMDSKMVMKAPDLDDNLDRRLHRKILTEAKQIPHEHPGIVYIEGVPLHTGTVETPFDTFFGPFKTPFELSSIEEAVFENQHLLFVALGDFTPLGTISKIDSYSGMYFSHRDHSLLISETSLLVTNKFHLWPRFRNKQLINAFWRR